MTIQLKKCTIEAIEQLREISIETFTDTFGAYNTPEDLAAYLEKANNLAQLTKELQTPESEFYFLYEDNELAGYMKLNFGEAQSEHIGEQALEVERIYIRTNFKRRGFGRLMIEKAMNVAKEKGCSTIWLGVWEQNFAAQAFYEKMGFARFSEHTFLLGADEQTDYLLKKNCS